MYKLSRWRIVKQDESDGDPEFTMTIRLGGKLTSYWKTNKTKFWKWRGVCKAYKNPISKFDVGHMSFENRRKACRAHVISITRSGMVGCMD
jgi:hypothetical protein